MTCCPPVEQQQESQFSFHRWGKEARIVTAFPFSLSENMRHQEDACYAIPIKRIASLQDPLFTRSGTVLYLRPAVALSAPL